jgi:hypothetical protein
VTAEAFLRKRAVNIAVGGRYSLANWFDHEGNKRDFACRTTRVSPFEMLISVPVVGRVGDHVVSYFSDFGRMDGWITDTVAGGFLLELAIEKARREKFANKLAWLERREKDASVREARNQKRIVPVNPHSSLVFADGSSQDCFVIDVSSSGAAVSAPVLPRIGTPLAVGTCVGRVVRHFREGFGVKFVELQNAARLEQLVIRPQAGVPASGAPATPPSVVHTRGRDIAYI